MPETTTTTPAIAGAVPVGAAGATPVISVIDIGSSGVRMLLAELKPDGSVRELEDVQKPLALGRETFRTGTLSAASIQKSVNMLRQYRAIMDGYGVTHTRAVATSAVRAALNRDTFVDRVFLATGIEVEVIEGSQGGGDVAGSLTYELGTLRVRDLLRAESGDKRAMTRLIQHNVKEMMNEVKRTLPFEKVANLIAIGPEARFAARALKGEGDLAAVSAKDLRALADKILGMTAADVAAAYSIPTPEAESLAPAFLVYAELIKLNPVDRLLVARASIRDGLLLQVLRSIQSGSAIFFPEQTIAAALNLARKYHADERHGLHTAGLARAIFEATRAQHGMGEGERLLLEVASIVHDIGNYVAARGHHRHAYYLLVNSEVFGLSKMDLEIVANVARYHRKGTPQSDHPAYAALPRAARLSVNRLSAIIRVADALDKAHAQRIQNPKITVEDGELRIDVETAEDIALERLTLDQKGSLFEEVFGLKPVLREVTA
ncbi:MAG: HD domain-containing protein [Candidatus Eisenbacteria bacterium]|uniref:HD domain-containing protein n=1 Tax=Eiseniibacteriota bacterium TaxID=2212470 RepID=A0A538SDX0_UNCEI|nr:MAG: HD domain-containing protein [Candidatus Eisenbacteria bacterium]